MPKLISFSLYGHITKYVLGLYENLDLAPTIYPEWDVRVYIDENHYAIENIKLRWPNVQVVTKPSTPGSSGMFWRLEAAFDTKYSHVIIRDVDSRLHEREAHYVKEWIESNKPLHVIRDHPIHNNIVILGGAHGYMPEHFQYLYEELYCWIHNNEYGDDEYFLKEKVFNKLDKSKILTHSSQSAIHGEQITIPTSSDKSFICEPIVPGWKKYLSKLYVINAPQYKERFKKFCEVIKTSEILSSLEIVRVEGRKLEDEPIPSWFNQEHKHWWLVTQDHKALLKKLIIGRNDLALIFEDDGHPNKYFDEYFEKAWVRLDTDKQLGDTHTPWTAFMLGGQDNHNREYVSDITRDSLARATGVYGQHSILWNYSGLSGFYDHAMYWNYETIDVAFAGYQKQTKSVYTPARWITDIVGVQFGKDR